MDAEITEGSGWFSFSSKDYANSSKHGTINDGLNVLYVYYKSNTGREQRQLNYLFGLQEKNPKPSALFNGRIATELTGFGAWVELPERKENANYQYVTITGH